MHVKIVRARKNPIRNHSMLDNIWSRYEISVALINGIQNQFLMNALHLRDAFCQMNKEFEN